MDTQIYRERRETLGRSIGKGGIAFILGARLKERNGDVHYPFRQESDMLYLSGFNEPDALLVILGGKTPRSILFCAPKDPEREIWEGKRFGPEGAKLHFGFDETHSNAPPDEMALRVAALLEGRIRVFTPDTSDYATCIIPLLEILDAHKDDVKNVTRERLSKLLGEQRLFKDEHEIVLMQKAADISGATHREVLSLVRPGMSEYELEAEITYRFRKAGGDPLHAYPPIVAGGANALTLHYIENDMTLNDGDLVLVDAGCEYGGYASDITRTFPMNGKFTPAQRSLYALVLLAQKAAIEEAWHGNTLHAPHHAASMGIKKGLIALGIMSGHATIGAKKKAPNRFSPHGTSHFLGLDVHDTGDYKRHKSGKNMRTLEAGMVITVEPGIYITPAPDVPEKYWNIGIRIEDDVLITSNGSRILSASAPKEIEEIEAIMQSSKQ